MFLVSFLLHIISFKIITLPHAQEDRQFHTFASQIQLDSACHWSDYCHTHLMALVYFLTAGGKQLFCTAYRSSERPCKRDEARAKDSGPNLYFLQNDNAATRIIFVPSLVNSTTTLLTIANDNDWHSSSNSLADVVYVVVHKIFSWVTLLSIFLSS